MRSKERRAIVNIAGLVTQLEEGVVDPKTLDKKTLLECAVLLKNRSYSSVEIARVLKVDERTVQRYIREYRKKTRLELGENFQQELIAEIVNNMRLRCQRLWKLVDSGKLSPAEEARTICAIHQVEMDRLSMMERLGYIEEALIKNQVMEAYELAVEEREQREAAALKCIHDKRLTPEQVNELKHYYIGEMRVYPHKSKELPERMQRMVEMFIEENEFLRQRSIDVALASAGLCCNINVVNRLNKYGN